MLLILAKQTKPTHIPNCSNEQKGAVSYLQKAAELTMLTKQNRQQENVTLRS